ncbi:MAG: prepilin peptidase [Candidatus Lariskella arthropodorum]
MVEVLCIISLFYLIISPVIVWVSYEYPRIMKILWMTEAFELVQKYYPQNQLKFFSRKNTSIWQVVKKIYRYNHRSLATFVLLSITLIVLSLNFSITQLLLLAVLSSILMMVFWIDIDHQYIFDAVTIPLVWVGVLLNYYGMFTSLQSSVSGAVFGYAILTAINMIYLLIKGYSGIGAGDAKLLAVFGAWFGWLVVSPILLVAGVLLFFSYLFLKFSGRLTQSKSIGFGPLLIAGLLVSYVVFLSYFHS